MYGDKLRTIRELRGYSQEYVSEKLGIAQNTYSKIETGQTKLSAALLEKVATILGVSPVDILSASPTIVNFRQHQHPIADTYFEEYHPNREFFQKIVLTKDEEIKQLKEVILNLIKEKESLYERLIAQSQHPFY